MPASTPRQRARRALVTRTRARAPAGAVPSKFTVRFSGVRPKRRAGSDLLGPSTSTSTSSSHQRRADLPADPPLDRLEPLEPLDLHLVRHRPHSVSLSAATVRGRGEKTKENWFS
jgi:hypothetical protein